MTMTLETEMKKNIHNKTVTIQLKDTIDTLVRMLVEDMNQVNANTAKFAIPITNSGDEFNVEFLVRLIPKND